MRHILMVTFAVLEAHLPLHRVLRLPSDAPFRVLTALPGAEATIW